MKIIFLFLSLKKGNYLFHRIKSKTMMALNPRTIIERKKKDQTGFKNLSGLISLTISQQLLSALLQNVQLKHPRLVVLGLLYKF